MEENNGQPSRDPRVTQAQLEELRDLIIRRRDCVLRIESLSARILDDLAHGMPVEPGRFSPRVVRYQRGSRRVEQLQIR